VLVLRVLQGNLGFLLEISKLVGVLEHEMHQALHVNLNLNLMLLLEILELSLLVAEFGFFVFELLLADHPEVGNSDTLVIVHVSQLVLVLDLLLESTALLS